MVHISNIDVNVGVVLRNWSALVRSVLRLVLHIADVENPQTLLAYYAHYMTSERLQHDQVIIASL